MGHDPQIENHWSRVTIHEKIGKGERKEGGGKGENGKETQREEERD